MGDEGDGFFWTKNVEEGWRGTGETKAKNETLQNERKVSLKFFIFYRLHVSYFLLHFFPHFPLPFSSSTYVICIFFSPIFHLCLLSPSLCSTRKIFIFSFSRCFFVLEHVRNSSGIKVPFMKSLTPLAPLLPAIILLCSRRHHHHLHRHHNFFTSTRFSFSQFLLLFCIIFAVRCVYRV